MYPKTKNKRLSEAKDTFDYISIKIASPEEILKWSHGEVQKPETINYRTQRSEKGGLFDEKIFGPDHDYECACGKYRGVRYKGIVCEKCGVELTRSFVRRERMGHIELATPVGHIWYVKGSPLAPSRVALILGMRSADVEKVVYFAGYLVTLVDEEERKRILSDLDSEFKAKIKTYQDEKTKEQIRQKTEEVKNEINSIRVGTVLDENQYHSCISKYSTLFEAEIGAEVIYKQLKRIDLAKLEEEVEKKIAEIAEKDADSSKLKKLNDQLVMIKYMIRADIRPEWMCLTVLPVIPPGLRPMIALEGGRQASSDVNDLYRRVINRNNRLKKLQEIHAPDVILRNEKRILQEAVDALLNGGDDEGTATSNGRKKELNSISDYLIGKHGYMRGNLLGKRVDYSGRSVIVVGPNLKFHQCGLPKKMALELFKPFIVSELMSREIAQNIRSANHCIEEQIPEVWEILEKVIQGKFVLLNRAPSLHRLSIQAFQPILIEGNAIQLHPLVCSGFNADFDGDTQSVHLPLSEEAQMEAREIMASDKNILKPGSGAPVTAAKLLEIVYGTYWMTKMVPGEKGEGRYYASPSDAIMALDNGVISYRAKITVLGLNNEKYAAFQGKPFETTVGRIFFNEVLPADFPFINELIDRKRVAKLNDEVIEKYGLEKLAMIMDNIKQFGFKYTTAAGVTWGLNDVHEPGNKDTIVNEGIAAEREVEEQYGNGLLSDAERARAVIQVWHETKRKLEKDMKDNATAFVENGPVYDLITSGARGSMNNVIQMAGMKGLIANNQGNTLEFPITSSYINGLTPIEYFLSTHGARKGLTDTAMNTGTSGYLTRRLFDSAQDVLVTEVDCGTKNAITVSRGDVSSLTSMSSKIFGRILAEKIEEKGISFPKGHLLSKKDALKIEESNVDKVVVRSPLTCATQRGICAHCYGSDLSTGQIIDIGEAIGTIAAQAIGEPGTQLTMRTFHSGGVASTSGDIAGKKTKFTKDIWDTVIAGSDDVEAEGESKKEDVVPYIEPSVGLPRVVEIFDLVKSPQVKVAIINKYDGEVMEVNKNTGTVKVLSANGKKKGEEVYQTGAEILPQIKVGALVGAGDILSEGSALIQDIFKYGGEDKARNYIISQVSAIYEAQGESVAPKHLEVIVRQIFSYVRVKKAGDTSFTEGEEMEKWLITEENNRVKGNGGVPAVTEPLILGIKDVSRKRYSFLSSISFQDTKSRLVLSSIQGVQDHLYGLKENVMVGRLVPTGTGFPGSKKAKAMKKLQDEIRTEFEIRQTEKEEAATLTAVRTQTED